MKIKKAKAPKVIEYQTTWWLNGHCVGCDEGSGTLEELKRWWKQSVAEIGYCGFDRVTFRAPLDDIGWDSDTTGNYVEINDNA